MTSILVRTARVMKLQIDSILNIGYCKKMELNRNDYKKMEKYLNEYQENGTYRGKFDYPSGKIMTILKFYKIIDLTTPIEQRRF